MLNIEIEKLTIIEKVQAMEVLWDSLCADVENIGSPVWHAELLQERELTLHTGNDTFVDWHEAKQDIRKQLL